MAIVTHSNGDSDTMTQTQRDDSDQWHSRVTLTHTTCLHVCVVLFCCGTAARGQHYIRQCVQAAVDGDRAVCLFLVTSYTWARYGIPDPTHWLGVLRCFADKLWCHIKGDVQGKYFVGARIKMCGFIYIVDILLTKNVSTLLNYERKHP